MKFERTLPGNPHQLTRNQHIFPRSAIQRFVNDKGMVHVERLPDRNFFHTRSKNSIFCAQRAWDHATETSRSHPIEEAYGDLAERISQGAIATLNASMSQTVSEFFFLWNHRFKAARLPAEDVVLNLVTAARELSQDQEERLEAAGVMFLRGNKLPARFLNGMSIMLETRRAMQTMADARWGIVRAGEGEFLVPDNSAGISIIPVCPTVCLIDGAGDITLNLRGVGWVNRCLKDQAARYVFARDLEACPILRRSLLP